MKSNQERILNKIFVSPAIRVAFAFAVVVTVTSIAKAQTNSFPGSGNAGVGTTSPGNLLQVNSSANPASSQVKVTANGAGAFSILNYASDNVLIAFDADWASNNWIARHNSAAFLYKNGNKLVFKGQAGLTNGSSFSPMDRMTIDLSNGNIGIGIPSPTEKLQVGGNAKITGSLTVDGTINTRYQDMAEWVPAAHNLPAGTVVVLDPDQPNQVMASGKAYDTRVAGIVSEKPGLMLGEGGEGKLLVATTGRVRVMVDARNGRIAIGDLLVTSDISGVAMKSVPVEIGGVQIHRPGTLIGKALEPLAKGRGEILVLLSLQ